VENRIDGAVLSLFDIDVIRRHEQELAQQRDFSQAIVETLREPLLVLDDQLRVKIANRAFYQDFGSSAPETIDRFIYDLGKGQWNIPELRMLLEQIVPKNGRIEGYRVEHEFPQIGRKAMLLNARRLDAADGHPAMVLLAFEDITGRQP
jgi:two-component system CheB/CheR fusion protein